MRKNSTYKMQHVSFKNVEEFLDFLPEDELKLTGIFRQLIFDCVPGIQEKLSFNVPFYKKNKGMFFIWPASVLWGKNPTFKGVRLGFQQGCLMADELKFLDKGNRKQIYWRDFITLKDNDIEIIKSYLFEAAIIDEHYRKKK